MVGQEKKCLIIFIFLLKQKTNGFSTIEEYLTYKSNQVPGNEEVHFSHWDQVAKSLFPKHNI